jgi:hypothetical protein
MPSFAFPLAAAIGHPSLGYIVPAVVFVVSFWVAWACYKHFRGQAK